MSTAHNQMAECLTSDIEKMFLPEPSVRVCKFIIFLEKKIGKVFGFVHFYFFSCKKT